LLLSFCYCVRYYWTVMYTKD